MSSNSAIHNTFTEKNRFTIDDVGNIGISQNKALFNTNEIGTNVTTENIFDNEENRKKLLENVDPFDVYVIGNNVIRIFGQPIPIFTVKN